VKIDEKFLTNCNRDCWLGEVVRIRGYLLKRFNIKLIVLGDDDII
jgi:hypothetical protein